MFKMPMKLLILLPLISLCGCFEREYSERIEPVSKDLNIEDVNVRYWQNYISEPIIQPNCISCHQAGGIAADSGLLLAHNGQDNFLLNNLAQVRRYMATSTTQLAQTLSSDSHSQLLGEINAQQQNALNLFNQITYLAEHDLDDSLIQAQQFYLQNVSDSVVQLECVLCHSQSIHDSAKQLTPLYFDFSEQSSSHQFNALMAMSYVLLSASSTQLVDKAIGQNHGGGQILPKQSDSAQQLINFINLIPN